MANRVVIQFTLVSGYFRVVAYLKSVTLERSKATQDVCIQRAKKIFEPFHLEFGHIDW